MKTSTLKNNDFQKNLVIAEKNFEAVAFLE